MKGGFLTPFFGFIHFRYLSLRKILSVHRFLLFCLFFFPFVGATQYNWLFLKSDTLTIKHRTGGAAIDSLDWYHAAEYTLTPGGAWMSPFGKNGATYTQFPFYFATQFQTPNPLKSQFTALPHLGFMYSFGSSGLQYVNAEYQQTFNKNTHLNFSYARNATSAAKNFIRNSNFSNDEVRFLIDHQGRKYENLVHFHFAKSEKSLSGGIRTDTLIEDFGIEFSPVYKANANSLQKNLIVGSQHAFNFTNDSVVKHGFVYKNRWSIENRVYNESDTLYGIYERVNIDSNLTRDQFQLARISNSGGYFFKSNLLKIEALVQHSYWKFQNLGVNRDTNEVEFQTNLAFHWKGIDFTNELKLNLIGALGEWNNLLKAQLHLQDWHVNGLVSTGATLPSPFQREYFANNYNWKLDSYQTQQHTKAEVEVKHNSFFDLTAKIGYSNWQNTYFFIDSLWKNDVFSSIQLVSGSVRGTLQWKSLYLQPSVGFTSTNSNFAYLPRLDLRARAYFNKKLFKAKKLDFIFGADFRYRSSYRLAYYESGLDVYRFGGASIVNEANLEIDVFTGIQIDQFRFYLKMENLDYFWNPRTNLQQIGFPVSPNVIRLGLTWDFFN